MWIDVNKKLPVVEKQDGDFKTSESVICRFEVDGNVWAESCSLKLWFEDDQPEWYYDYCSEMVSNTPTHWMKIPKIKN